MLICASCDQPHKRIGKLAVFTDELSKRALDEIREPSFKWGTRRHSHFPTTDIELHELPWLDREALEPLRHRIFPAISAMFSIPTRWLWLRDFFLVKYDASAGQSHLPQHRDSSVFSFVIQLSDKADFAGGGTHFTHVGGEALTVRQGECLIFAGGLCEHSGVAVTLGARYILAGFVDLRGPVELMQAFALEGAQRAAADATLARPYLRRNVSALREAYSATSGLELLRRIAYHPPVVEHLDIGELRRQLTRWLETGSVANNQLRLLIVECTGRVGLPCDEHA